MLLVGDAVAQRSAERAVHASARAAPRAARAGVGYDTFVSRYCVTKFGRGGRETVVGPNKQTAPELKRIMGRFARRVKKADVQKDLPAVIVDALPVNVLDLVVPEKMMADWRVVGSAARGATSARPLARRPWRWRDRARTRRPIAA